MFFWHGLHYNNLTYLSPYWHPHQEIQINGYIQLFSNHSLKIQLTHSSYKVTSFLDFQPFLQGFQSVNKYLNDLWTDINNPSYFWHLFLPFAHVLIDPTLNNSHIENFLTSSTCHHCPYACQVKMKFE